MKFNKWIAAICILFVVACTSDGNEDGDASGGNQGDFNRSVILTNWADNFIIPNYKLYTSATSELSVAAESFAADNTIENLSNLRSAFKSAYKNWQKVSMFEIGQAEKIQLRNFTNIYPTQTANIDAKTSGEQDYNLELPSTYAEQGFPALDYLLYGTGGTDEEVIAYFTSREKANAYLLDVSQRINSLASQVLNAWENGYRDSYVSDDSDAVNASFSKTVNAYISYYERFLRSGKIGIPAGALSGNKFPERVEAYYANDFSKELFSEALLATTNFYKGSSGNSSGAGLYSALNDLDKKILADDILEQFSLIKSESDKLKDSFSTEVETNNNALIGLRDLLQINTILFKNDMVSALNVTISYQDNDGD
ncbi:imelysin family protein [Galbibacter mesophilus]|uniref:imelysin family protein n=1 Tax=Galbibacter mesophilus TaxID=379069 RepID=UPI00191FB615|nr:imelysin family protein [Galbibacter mesophilus]MCM5663932.1 imelysin family protein [Galbibacter mesophilus]